MFLLTPRFAIFCLYIVKYHSKLSHNLLKSLLVCLDLNSFGALCSECQYWNALFLRFGLCVLIPWVFCDFLTWDGRLGISLSGYREFLVCYVLAVV